MANDQTKVVVTRQGIGFCGVLFIVLLLLKVGVIETMVTGWSWWWITSPLWGPLALFIGGFLIAGLVCAVIFGIAWIIDYFRSRKNQK